MTEPTGSGTGNNGSSKDERAWTPSHKISQPGETKGKIKSSRSRDTKERMLEAGARVFARYGPEGVSTRQLAREAGVNSAAIQYHFGSKEGYYLAVVRHLVRVMGTDMLESARRARQELEDAKDRQAVARRLLPMVLEGILETTLTNPRAQHFARISVREHLNPTGAYDVIYDALSPIHETITALTAAIFGLDPGSSEAIMMAHALLGQVLLFRIEGRMVARRLGRDELTAEDLVTIRKVVRSLLERLCGAPIEEASR